MKRTKGKGLFRPERRDARENEKQFHLLLSGEEFAKLVELSHARKMSGADVLRALIMGA